MASTDLSQADLETAGCAIPSLSGHFGHPQEDIGNFREDKAECNHFQADSNLSKAADSPRVETDGPCLSRPKKVWNKPSHPAGQVFYLNWANVYFKETVLRDPGVIWAQGTDTNLLLFLLKFFVTNLTIFYAK